MSAFTISGNDQLMTDALGMDLVREYARHHSEAAFAELVRWHLGLVYSVARRCTASDSDAQDVAQAVFGRVVTQL